MVLNVITTSKDFCHISYRVSKNVVENHNINKIAEILISNDLRSGPTRKELHKAPTEICYYQHTHRTPDREVLSKGNQAPLLAAPFRGTSVSSLISVQHIP